MGRELTLGMQDDIHTAMREARDPGRYSVHELRVDARPVVVLSIARRVEGFSQTSSGRVLVRRGTMKIALFGAELARFTSSPPSSSAGARSSGCAGSGDGRTTGVQGLLGRSG